MCQFGLSYKRNANAAEDFVVLSTVRRGCLVDTGMSFSVPIPGNAPSGNAILFWTWINRVGNREYYMNCADVNVQGVNGGKIEGDGLFVANPPTNGPVIPEWGTSGEDFTGYLDARARVEQFADGNTRVLRPKGNFVPSTPAPPNAPSQPVPQPAPQPASQPAPASQASQPATQPAKQPAPQPAQPAQPAAPAGSGCANAAQRCISSNANKWEMCSNGVWVQMVCPPSLVCAQTGSAIHCAFAKGLTASPAGAVNQATLQDDVGVSEPQPETEVVSSASRFFISIALVLVLF